MCHQSNIGKTIEHYQFLIYQSGFQLFYSIFNSAANFNKKQYIARNMNDYSGFV